MRSPIRLLHLEDDPVDAELVLETLQSEGMVCESVRMETCADFLAALEQGEWDLILADYALPGFDGMMALAIARERRPEIPFIFVSGAMGEELAIEALKGGATDYVLKQRMSRLGPAVCRALHEAEERAKRTLAEERLAQQMRLAELGAEVGIVLVQNVPLQRMLQQCAEAMARHLNAAFARIWTFDPEKNLLELQASAGIYTHLDGPHSRVPLGQLKIGLIAQERRPHLTNAVLGDPRIRDQEWARREGMVAFAGYPLMVEDRTVGVAAMFARHPIPELTFHALGSVVDEIALGIDRKRAEDSLQQQLMRISLLNQITRAIGERQDMHSILYTVLQQLEAHHFIDTGVVYFFNPQADTLTLAVRGPKGQQLAAAMGLPREGMAIPVEQTAARVCTEGEMLYLPDISQVDRPAVKKLAQTGIRSVLGAPLMVEGKVVGILFMGRCQTDGFSSEDSEFLRILSEHVSQAAHQAHLYQDLRKAYDELSQTQQAVMRQERLRALGQMASGIVHDINNALSPIIGFSDLLLIGREPLSDRTRQYLEMIRTAGTDIDHITGRMREFYRKREEREPLFPVQLDRLAQQVIDLTRPRWKDIPQERGVAIEIRTHFAPDLPYVMGVESEIREALTNLIFNAVDAMPNGGALTLRAYPVAALLAKGGDRPVSPPQVVVEISDTGIGMDEETRRNCLEPFFTTKGERGTGLGLSMVYGVMQRHEGEIDVESTRGQGTTMRLIFPVRTLSEVSGPPSSEAAIPPPLRVLCIDDEPLLRRLMQEMLEHDGHRVEVADGGQPGLERFRASRERGEPFDVVITDLGMPHMEGREVARTVKHESPTTPVILLTGWGTRLAAEGDVPAQVDLVLGKPPKVKALRQALAQVARTLRETSQP